MREHDKINIKLGVYRGDQKMVKYVEVAQTIMDEVKKAVIGKDECVKKILAAILAGGHILIRCV